MLQDKHRYFIELPVDGGDTISRRAESQARRERAAEFVSQISQWIHDQELKDKVSSIDVTALGQVLITCEQDIIARIREQESLNIVAIRNAASLSRSAQRVAG